MRPDILLHALRSARRGIAWWSVGLIAYVALIAGVWPSVRDNPALIKLHETYPESLRAFISFGGELDFGTPTGFLGAELFSLLVPLLLIVAALGAGARELAGEEEAGTLDLLLAHPVSRRRVAAEKLLALWAEVVLLGGVLLGALWAGTSAAGMGIAPSQLLAAVTAATLLAIAYGTLALLAGAATGRRSLAIAVPSALVVLAYLVNALGPLVDVIERLRPASPWFHYAASDALRSGLAADHAGVLAGLALALALLVPLVLERRDLSS